MTHESDPIRDYIRTHRERYTHEAITERLVAAGHERSAIDASWERLAAEEPMTQRHGANMAPYAWIIYGLGAAAIIVFTVILGLAGGLVLFGVGWLVTYAVLAVWPIWWLSGREPESVTGIVAVVLAAPIIVLLIGGGICAATIAVLTSSFGG